MDTIRSTTLMYDKERKVMQEFDSRMKFVALSY